MEREVKNKTASIRAKLMNIERAEKIDIDFLVKEIKNDPVELEHIFRSITEIPCDDGVKFFPYL